MTSESTHWFYIRHIASNKVIASCDNDTVVRSQVIVTKPKFTDNELWCWDGGYLKNKSTGLVLDIRKGRIRFMDDTEICLYHKKPAESCQNQLWAVQTDIHSAEHHHPLAARRRSSQKIPQGSIIYSVFNNDWVLDVCPEGQKLILFPCYDLTDQQRWDFVSEGDAHLLMEDPKTIVLEDQPITDGCSLSSSISSILSSDSSPTGFAYGLTPAKRGSSQSSHSSSRKSSLL